MTQKRKLVSKLFVAVVVLTLVSCCFLASTFARYTSGGNGTGTVEVATWAISGPGEGEFNATFDQLSPSMDEYENTPRTHSTAPVLVATIKNTGDVDALVTLTTGASTITEPAEGWGGDGGYSESEIEGLFTIALYTSTTNGAADSVVGLNAYNAAINVPKTNGTLYVYAVVTWTSDDDTVKGEPADARDTWVSENVTGVSFDISYTAVQNSELPA